MSFFSCILGCWLSTSTQYADLSKKDDDLGVEALNQWKKSYPIKCELSNLGTKEINEYVDNLIKGLSQIPITSSNVDSVKEHLVGVGKHSNRARCRLLEKVSNVKAEEQLTSDIKIALVFTVAKGL